MSRCIERPRFAYSPTSDIRMEIREYGSLRRLRELLHDLDDDPRADALRVLIMLDENFCGELAALARRRRRGLRLVIATSAERLAGVAETYAQEGIYWEQIAVERGVERTLRNELRAIHPAERLITFWPNW